MAMEVKQKELREHLFVNGFMSERVIDCSHYGQKEYDEIIKQEKWLEPLLYSKGVYGCNGKLLIGRTTGKQYVIVGRTPALWIFA